VNTVLRPVSPFVRAEELYRVTAPSTRGEELPAQERLLLARRRLPALGNAILVRGERPVVDVAGDLRSRWVLRVAPGFFGMLGARPSWGVLDVPLERLREDAPVAVVSERLWRLAVERRRTSGELTILLDGASHSVVGVAPPGTELALGADVWVPTTPERLGTAERWGTPELLVRVAAGTTRASLESELRKLAAGLARELNRVDRPLRFGARPAAPPPAVLTNAHTLLIAAALVILLIASANLANLTLARTRARSPRHAVMRALGASPAAIAREVIAECFALSAVGGALGLALAFACAGVMRAALPTAVPLIGQLHARVDWVVAASAMGLSALVALAFGALPALHAARTNPAMHLGTRGTSAFSRQRLSSAIVILQLALALALTTSGVLMMRASARVATMDLGYEPRGLFEVQVSVQRTLVQDTLTSRRTLDDIASSLSGVPGVLSAAWWEHPGGGVRHVEGATSDGQRSYLYSPALRSVSWNYLRTLTVAVVDGRDFEPGDQLRGDVAVVDERTAGQLWPRERAVGRQLAIVSPGGAARWLTVVGVSRRARFGASVFDVFDVSPGAIFVASPPLARQRGFIVRSRVENHVQTRMAVLARASDLSPRGGWIHPTAIGDDVANVALAHRFLARTLIALALGAMGMGVLGLFAVLSFASVTRRHEFAIRIALGATPGRVLAVIARDSATLALGGTAIGGLLAIAATRIVDPFLFDLYRVDARSLIVAELVLLIACTAAAARPALHAMRVDAREALQGD
jgi:putative ABC transport system permease protein